MNGDAAVAIEDAIARIDQPAGVLIVEPHDVYRVALVDLVGTSNEISVVAAPADRDEAVYAATTLDPAVILLCVRDVGDVGVIQRLASSAPRAAIVAFSSREDGEVLLEVMRAGAIGFLPKRAQPEEILDALMRAMSGEKFVHPSIAQAGLVWAVKSLERRYAYPDRQLEQLTGREREILNLLAEGLSPTDIATRFFNSRRTIEGHLASAYRKLGVHNRIEAVERVFRAEDAS